MVRLVAVCGFLGLGLAFTTVAHADGYSPVITAAEPQLFSDSDYFVRATVSDPDSRYLDVVAALDGAPLPTSSCATRYGCGGPREDGTYHSTSVRLPWDGAQHTIAVQAFDPAGNASNVVTVTVTAPLPGVASLRVSLPRRLRRPGRPRLVIEVANPAGVAGASATIQRRVGPDSPCPSWDFTTATWRLRNSPKPSWTDCDVQAQSHTLVERYRGIKFVGSGYLGRGWWKRVTITYRPPVRWARGRYTVTVTGGGLRAKSITRTRRLIIGP